MKVKILFMMLMMASFLPASAQFRKAKLQASGLTCAMCAKSIFKNLQAIPFVDTVDTDLNTSTFVMIFKSNVDVDPDLILKKVEDAGFAIASLQLTGEFNDVAIKNDSHVNINGQSFHFINTGDQVLSGERTIKIVDKSFISLKEHKKFVAATKMECIKTGSAEACCTKLGFKESSRIFHVTI